MHHLLQSLSPAVFYSIAGIICLGLGWLLSLDTSLRFSEPEITRYNAFGIAALRGPAAHLIHTVLFSLWRKKAVVFADRGGDFSILPTGAVPENAADLETATLRVLKKPLTFGEATKGARLRGEILRCLKPLFRNFESAHLFKSPEEKSVAWKSIWLPLILLLTADVYRILSPLQNKGTKFESLLWWLGIVCLLVWTARPGRMLTQLGVRHLKSLQENFGWVKTDMERGKMPAGIDPVLAVALFGVGVLQHHIDCAEFYKIFLQKYKLDRDYSFRSGGGSGGGWDDGFFGGLDYGGCDGGDFGGGGD